MYIAAAAATLLLAGASVTPPGAPHAVLRLWWEDPHRTLGFPHQQVAEALAAELAPSNITFTWSEWPGGGELGPDDVLVVALLDPAPYRLPRDLMGTASQRDAAVRAVHVWMEPPRRTLSGEDYPPWRVSAQEVARGVARVVYHELVHLFLPERGHAAYGLLRPRISRRELLHGTLHHAEGRNLRLAIDARRAAGPSPSAPTE